MERRLLFVFTMLAADMPMTYLPRPHSLRAIGPRTCPQPARCRPLTHGASTLRRSGLERHCLVEEMDLLSMLGGKARKSDGWAWSVRCMVHCCRCCGLLLMRMRAIRYYVRHRSTGGEPADSSRPAARTGALGPTRTPSFPSSARCPPALPPPSTLRLHALEQA